MRRSAWEPRPENDEANHTVPSGLELAAWDSMDPDQNAGLLARIDGNFTGTTDEILQ